MAAFTSKVDIGNRALQHCGADRMGSDGFSEDSKRASEVSFVYDKVRVAELQENVWTFATRRATLRAVDTATMMLNPAMWSQTTTYYRGSIASDQVGNLWISRVPGNIGNDPLLTNVWEPYFGPLTVSSYDSTATYGAGELVYTYAGDGTYRVYLSMQDANSDVPATATAWNATVTYAQDQVVTFTGGNDSFAKVLLHFDGADASTTITDNNAGGSAHAWTANGNAQIDTAQSKFGGASGLFDGAGSYVTALDSPDFTLGAGDWTVDLWFRVGGGDGTTMRLAGQCDASLTATTRSFMISRTAANIIQAQAFVGAVGTVCSGTTQFTTIINPGWHHVALVRTGNTLKLFVDGVQEGGDQTITGSVNDSANALSVGRLGEEVANYWNGWIDEFRLSVSIARWTANFAPPQVAYASGVVPYMSLFDLNLNQQPDTHPLAWTTTFTGGTGSVKWLEIGGVDFPTGVGLTVPNIVYPLGSGPSSQSNSQNIFKLPAGYLRIAPQNPKVAVPMLGAPTGNTYNDWQIENGYIVSADDGPIRLRFVADVTDVTKMDALFCEGLAARIGLEIAQPITQSDARLQTIASLYKRFMDRAKVANSIEAGYDDPPDDVYVSVRL
jgi:hypothetical protein